MTDDILTLSPSVNNCIMTVHTKATVRAHELTGVVNGNRVVAMSPATMSIRIGGGRLRMAGVVFDKLVTDQVISTADATFPRIDVVIRQLSDGAVVVVEGSPGAVDDPANIGFWRGFVNPVPSNAVPDGAILAAVYVPAGATEISDNEIWEFAVKVPDVLTTVGDPGSDNVTPSEKAVRTALNSKIGTADIVTTVGEVGSDTKVPSEQAVRELAQAISAETVTNGDLHNHEGGDGAQVDHGSLSGRTDDDHSIYHNDARGDARYSPLGHSHDMDFAPIEKGVSGGDSHDILHAAAYASIANGVTGGDNHSTLHDARFALISKGVTGGDSHNALHDSYYAPIAKGVTGGDNHSTLHDGRFSLLGHLHDGNYAALSHLHDERYSVLAHLHTALYAPIAKGVTGGDSHNALHDSAYAPIAKGVTGGDSHNTLHASAFAPIAKGVTGGDNHSALHDAIYAPIAKGVTNGDAHDHNGGDGAAVAYSSLSGKPVRRFAVEFPFGDGLSTIPLSGATSTEYEIPVAGNIIAVRIHERNDIVGNLVVNLWKRTFTGGWTQIDSFTISSNNKYEEALNIALAAGDWITAGVSSVSAMQQVTVSFTVEAT